MNSSSFELYLAPAEDLQNPARTKHAIIKRPQASWAQSVFSVPLGSKVVPNRDYPYEGLSVLLNGENYQFLNGIAAGVKRLDGAYVPLRATKVTISPWKMRYRYENKPENVHLVASYYLLAGNARQEGSTACLALEANASSVLIEPLVDIRHMYEPSVPAEHVCQTFADGLLVARHGNCLSIRTTTDCAVRAWRREIEWWYKLGSGYREQTERGAAFRGERKTLLSCGELEISLENRPSALVIIACGRSALELERLQLRGKEWPRDEAREEERARAIVQSLGTAATDPAVVFRALALAKFGMYVKGEFFYEAGDFWFRTPWFRDLFEGIINNIETFLRIGDAEKIKGIIRHAFKLQDEYGRLPNRFPERSGTKLDYNAADATLLAFIAAGELLARRWDAELARELLDRAAVTLDRFAQNDLQRINGAPVLHQTGLISAVPWHTWTDSSRQIHVRGRPVRVPVRIPERWCEELADEREFELPHFFLPELNAQWIVMLRHLQNLALRQGVETELFAALLEKAKRNFKALFWDEMGQFVYNLVAGDGKRDSTPGSPAVVAFSLLAAEGIFSSQERDQFIARVKANLLVERNGLPFGILVKRSPKRTYYSDEEYHEAVVWPRDTPYLIRLLRLQGARESATVQGLLQSNLAHQMEEGFVFYHSELFSPDNGTMTPVKNPVQFWSQWVDPFLEQ